MNLCHFLCSLPKFPSIQPLEQGCQCPQAWLSPDHRTAWGTVPSPFCHGSQGPALPLAVGLSSISVGVLALIGLKKKISNIFKEEDQKACTRCDPVVSPCQAHCIMCSERLGCSAHSPALQSPPVMDPTFPVQKMCIQCFAEQMLLSEI